MEGSVVTELAASSCTQQLGLAAHPCSCKLPVLKHIYVSHPEGLASAVPAGKPSAGTKQTQPKHAGPSAAAAAAAGSTAGQLGGRPLWRLSDILGRPDEFRRVLSREIMSGKQVVKFGVVMLEAPVDAGHLQVRIAGTGWVPALLVVMVHAADVPL